MNTFKKDGSADNAYNLLLHTKVSESASKHNDSDVLFLIKRGDVPMENWCNRIPASLSKRPSFEMSV